MKRTMIAALAACSILALAGCRQAGTGNDQNAAATAGGGAIDGTWKADLSTVQMNSKPDQLLLKDGKFTCATCTPPIDLAADGAFHPVTGRPYADSISVKVDDDHNVTRTDKKDGRVTSEGKYSVSSDGNTLTINFTDSSTPNVAPVKGSFIETRVDPAPAGAHAISGSWKPSKYSNISDEALTVTYKLDGDTLHMSSPAGQSFDAKLDGTDAPVKGDIGGTTVSVQKNGDGFTITSKRAGKVLSVTTLTPGADGKLAVSSENKEDGSTMKYEANKQS